MTKKTISSNLRRQSFKERQLLNYWRRTLLELYNYKCFLTNSKTTTIDPLICHHLFSWSDNKSLRYNISNGVVLKKSVHKKFHDIYGYGYNTNTQFEQFCQTYYNVKINFFIKDNHEPIIQLNNEQNLLTFREQKQKKLTNLLRFRKHQLITGFYINHKNVIRILCLKRNKVYDTTFVNYFKSKTGLKCCGCEKQRYHAVLKNKKNKKNLRNNLNVRFKSSLKKVCQIQYQTYLILKKLNENNHKWLTGNYKNSYSELTFYCLIHHLKQTTNWKNYKRSYYGLKCCSKSDSKRW